MVYEVKMQISCDGNQCTLNSAIDAQETRKAMDFHQNFDAF